MGVNLTRVDSKGLVKQRPSGVNMMSQQIDSESGEHQAVSQAAEEAVRTANHQLEARTKEHLEAVVLVLIEQRDEALRTLAVAMEGAEKERAELVLEHDKFVAFLMEEQDGKADSLQKELSAARQALARKDVLGASVSSSQVPSQLADIRRLLEAAYDELDEHKALVTRLEDERDQAVAAVDDVRVELYSEIEAARDEAIGLQGQLDEAHRELEDERDRARDAAIEANTELDEVRRELDDRRQEVIRLRQRVEQVAEEVKHSVPPPPQASQELLLAREENQNLRRELIETKRNLSRMTREYEALRSLRARMTARVTASGVAAPPSPAARAIGGATAARRPAPGVGSWPPPVAGAVPAQAQATAAAPAVPYPAQASSAGRQLVLDRPTPLGLCPEPIGAPAAEAGGEVEESVSAGSSDTSGSTAQQHDLSDDYGIEITVVDEFVAPDTVASSTKAAETDAPANANAVDLPKEAVPPGSDTSEVSAPAQSSPFAHTAAGSEAPTTDPDPQRDTGEMTS